MTAGFIGRTDEIAAITAVLGSGVVTIVGPGGVGKTATATQVMAQTSRPAAIVELAPLGANDVGDALAAASGEGVMVIDNAEHVAAAVADWLAAHPDVPALVTSRVPLRLKHERVVELSLLPEADAVALFRDRAVRSGASPDDDAAIAELCRRLDNLPLAIELAAARARLLSPSAMTARLDDRFRVLAHDPHPTQEHHRSLHAAIAWSHDLLTDDERAALHRLSGFTDRFDLSQAEHVGVSIDTLDALVAHSLVASEPSAVVPYRLLESVRDFAVAQRSPDDERVALDGLVVWLDEATVLLDGYETAGRDALHARLDVVATDVRRALDHAMATRPDVAVTLFGRLGPWFWDRGRAAEGLRVGRRVAEVDPDDDALGTARLLNAIANLAVRSGDPANAVPLYEEALARRERLGASASQLASTRNDLGACYLHLGMLELAEASLAAARDLYASVDDRWGVSTATANLAAVAVTAGRWDGAARAFGDVAEEFLRLDDEVQAAAALTNKGLVLLEMDDDAAGETFGAATRLIFRSGMRAVLPSALAGAATAALAAGDAERAGRLWGAAAAAGFVDDGDLRARLEDAAGLDAFRALAAEGAAATDEVVLAWTEARAATRPSDRAVWERDGKEWRVAFEGKTIALPDIKGVGFIAQLLQRPGAEVHVADLLGVSTDQRGVEIADDAALAAYRHRVRELQAALDRADARGDAEAGIAAQAELDHLAVELKRATGKGGRVRLTGDDAERARKSATNRIRDAVRAIAELHPSLGRHLDHAVSTGTFCVYAPEHPVAWEVRT